jgi:hypothetical protein
MLISVFNFFYEADNIKGSTEFSPRDEIIYSSDAQPVFRGTPVCHKNHNEINNCLSCFLLSQFLFSLL